MSKNYFQASMASYMQQLHNAALTGQKYHEYAVEIGCQIFQDEIIATKEQGELLSKKWQELTK